MIGRATGTAAAVLIVSTLLAATAGPADAICCACGNCPGSGGFCIDGIPNNLVCATLCTTGACGTTNFDSVDNCAGGCDGATPQPTATTSATATATPTGTSTATHTTTGTVTDTPTNSPTPSITATATISPTPTATAALSGKILYYANDLPVSDVDIALVGATNATTMTDTDGEYRFDTVMPGLQTLQPNKQGDFDLAVTAFDATQVLQFVAGLESFTDDQLLAADVTGDGTVTALDGTRILQFQAGLLLRFEVADECQSDWVFRPSPMVIPNQTVVQPQISTGMCVKGTIAYGSMFVPPAPNQDFVAILFGDTSGNWMPAPTPTPP